jgi:ketosteroid isomerase-like protein
MSQENVDLVRALFEEISRLMAALTADPRRSMQDDYARVVARFLDPEFELVPAASAVERRTLRGSEGFVTFLEGGRETWRDARLEAEEFIDLGDQVLAVGTFRASGRASGVVIEQPNATVWKLRDGRVVGVQLFLDQREALAAAGLSE